MTASTLVLYDTTGQWGWLGELYAIMSANLASHFGSWTALPVASYQTGQLKQYSAAIYIGSTYGEPIPNAFLDDVYGTTTPVIWAYDNIWQLTARYPNFSSVYGWNWSGFDFSSVAEVDYPLPPSTRRDTEVETLRRKRRRDYELCVDQLQRHRFSQLRPLRWHHLSLGVALGWPEWRQPHLYRRKPARLYIGRRSVFGLLRPPIRRARGEHTGTASRSPTARGHRSDIQYHYIAVCRQLAKKPECAIRFPDYPVLPRPAKRQWSWYEDNTAVQIRHGQHDKIYAIAGRNHDVPWLHPSILECAEPL